MLPKPNSVKYEVLARLPDSSTADTFWAPSLVMGM